jgi:hypothetical protein
MHGRTTLKIKKQLHGILNIPKTEQFVNKYCTECVKRTKFFAPFKDGLPLGLSWSSSIPKVKRKNITFLTQVYSVILS